MSHQNTYAFKSNYEEKLPSKVFRLTVGGQPTDSLPTGHGQSTKRKIATEIRLCQKAFKACIVPFTQNNHLTECNVYTLTVEPSQKRSWGHGLYRQAKLGSGQLTNSTQTGYRPLGCHKQMACLQTVECQIR